MNLRNLIVGFSYAQVKVDILILRETKDNTI